MDARVGLRCFLELNRGRSISIRRGLGKPPRRAESAMLAGRSPEQLWARGGALEKPSYGNSATKRARDPSFSESEKGGVAAVQVRRAWFHHAGRRQTIPGRAAPNMARAVLALVWVPRVERGARSACIFFPSLVGALARSEGSSLEGLPGPWESAARNFWPREPV